MPTPQRICVYSCKGGAGKTTAAVIMSLGLELPLRDLDPQCTATNWLARRKDCAAQVGLGAPDRWVADCPPGISGELVPVLRESELIVVPVRAAFQDLDTLPAALRFVQANSSAKVAFLLSAIDRRCNDEAMLRGLLQDFGYPVIGLFSHRAAYRRAGIGGHLPSDFDETARVEIKQLLDAIGEVA